MSEQEFTPAIAQSIIIKFLMIKGFKLKEIIARLTAHFGNTMLSHTKVYKWAKKSKDYHETVKTETQ